MRKLEKTLTFTKDLKKLPQNIKNESWETARLLIKDIFHKGLNIKKLEGLKMCGELLLNKNIE